MVGLWDSGAFHPSHDFLSFSSRLLARFSPENKGKIDPMTWLAFGQGPRMCVGQRFAMVEIYIILAKLLRKYRVEPCPDTEVRLRQGCTDRTDVNVITYIYALGKS